MRADVLNLSESGCGCGCSGAARGRGGLHPGRAAVVEWLRTFPPGFDLRTHLRNRGRGEQPTANPLLWSFGGRRAGKVLTEEQRAAVDPRLVPELAARWGHRGPKFKPAYQDPTTGDTRPAEGEAEDPDMSTAPGVFVPPEIYDEAGSDWIGVDPDRLDMLKGQVRFINLGPDGLFGGNVQASLNPGYEASTSKDEMLSEYLPLFWENLPLSWETAHANVADRWNQDTTPGLFWDDGWGYMHRGMLYAIQLLHMFADEARDDTSENYSNYNAGVLRVMLETGMFPLYVTNDQVVTTGHGTAILWVSPLGHVATEVRNIQYWAITLEVIEVPRAMRIFAATADYLFWWAHRLHSHAHQTGNAEEWWVGALCARAALAELVQLASILVHEWTHMTSGSGFHCKDLVGNAFGCVEYMIGRTFMFGAWARLGLPYSRNYETLNDARFPTSIGNDDRFADLAGQPGRTITIEGKGGVDGDEAGEVIQDVGFILTETLLGIAGVIDLINGWDDHPSCSASWMKLTRTRFWEAGAGYLATWSVPAHCAREQSVETGLFIVGGT